MPPETVSAISTILGDPSQNLFQQYVNYLGSILRFDFGVSTSNYPVEVADIIGAALPWTIGLVVMANILAWVIGTILGLVAGWKRGTRIDQALSLTSVLALSVPAFWIALVILSTFAFQLGWFPNSGAYDPALQPGFNAPFILSVLSHAVLPMLSIIVVGFASWLIGMRNMTVVTVLEDYVLLARGKGLSTVSTMFKYAGRNAVLPNATGLAQAISHSIGGVLLIEIVFTYPGLGTVLFEATQSRDLPLMQSVFLLITVVVLIFNLLSDAVNMLLDPRLREGSN